MQPMRLPTFIESSVDHSGLNAPLVYEGKKTIAGELQVSIRRYEKPVGFMAEDVAVLNYQVSKKKRQENTLELKYCLVGNMYCRQFDAACESCKLQGTLSCDRQVETVDYFHFVFTGDALTRISNAGNDDHPKTGALAEQVITFRYDASFARSMPVCHRSRQTLDLLLRQTYSGTLENLMMSAQSQLLLLYTLDCLDDKQVEGISCKFLNNEADREKIIRAREVLLQHIGEPITIRQLSRKVAMNECYLKKGFKEMYGTTIFDFYQEQRMRHARYLLDEKGLNVTEVSDLLGYSSISHFSTAFKRHTGLKPCELLLRAS